MDNYRQRVLTGLGWAGFNQGGQQVLRFVIGVTLARLLSPREFGLLAMITVITGFASMFSELGLGAALVQKQNIRQDHLSSVFWLNVALGFVLMTLFVVGSRLLSGFYDEAMLRPLTIFVSTTFLIGSLNVVQDALMTKALNFRRLSIIGLASSGVSGVFAIIMACLGFGAWSLAFQMVICSSITAILLWRSGNWRPDFAFKWEAIRDLLGFSASLTATRALNYWVRNLDTLLIGRLLGSGPLGIYGRAYGLMLFPVNNVSGAISKVIFPSLSIIQKDKNKVKRIYLQMTRAVALISFPIMCGLFVTAEHFVIAVFGQHWAEMIPIVQIFSLSGIIQSIVTLVGNLFLSQGRAGLAFKIGLFLKPIPIIGIIIGLQWGIVGVAIGLAVASAINMYPNLFFAGRLVNLSFSEIVRDLSGVSACAIGMAALVWALGLSLPRDWPHWAYLIVQVPFGMILYVVTIHSFRLKAYKELQEVFREQVKPRLFAVRTSQEPRRS